MLLERCKNNAMIAQNPGKCLFSSSKTESNTSHSRNWYPVCKVIPCLYGQTQNNCMWSDCIAAQSFARWAVHSCKWSWCMPVYSSLLSSRKRGLRANKDYITLSRTAMQEQYNCTTASHLRLHIKEWTLVTWFECEYAPQFVLELNQIYGVVPR